MNLTFEINGRKVNPSNTRDALESAILQSVSDSISKKVGSVRCPEHGQPPKIVGKGRDLSKLSFDISGCCQKLIAAVKAKLG